MGYNYGRERRKFEIDFAKRRLEYAKAGMSESAIGEIYKFDLDVFNKNRTYATRNQSMLPDNFDEQDDAPDKLTVINKSIAYEQEFIFLSRYGWTDEIENPMLAKNIKKLSVADLELITLVMDGYTQREIAKMRSVSQKAISKKIVRIKNFLKNF